MATQPRLRQQPSQTPPPAPLATVPVGAAALLSTLAAILTSGLGAAAMLVLAVKALATVGISATAASAAFRLAGRLPQPAGEAEGIVGARTRSAELSYRVSYLLAAARRIEQSLQEARSRGESQLQSLRDALQKERRYFGQSLQATRNRANAATQIDHSSQVWGPVLGWNLGSRKVHTPECVKAAGHNFSIARRPRIGWPGMVHSQCGCFAGPPFASKVTVDQATAGMIGD